MWRNETKKDIKEREALAIKNGAKELNANPYWNPGKQQQTHNTTKAAKEYDERQARWKYEEEYKKRLVEDEEQEKQDFIKKIASVQNDEKAFTPAELYGAGIQARKEGDGVEATMRLWQAILCGEGKAAYPLFEILRDGEGGIPKNMEMAIITLGIGKRYSEPECLEIRNIQNPNIKATDKLFSVCAQSRKYITEPNKKITDEILFEIQDTANEVLDGFRLHTRAKEQPMLDVFQHPIIAEFEEKQEVHLAGNHETDTTCSFCCIS